jgi:TM2 domain-containing membrane protein YozV
MVKTRTKTQFRTAKDVDPQHGKSKIILNLLEFTGLGWLGIDRMYMGCVKSGLAKLGLLILGVIFYFLYVPYVAIPLLIIWFVWGLVDYCVLLYNSVILSYNVPWGFCRNRNQKWLSQSDVETGRTIALVLFVVNIIVGALAPKKW